jgi:predicted TIM-barrel fold metal-dependent hydrolase
MVSSRRDFLNTTLGADLALMTQGPQQAAGQSFVPQPARRRLIVDSQIHLWKANTPDRPWVPGAKPQLPEPFTIERLVPMMNEAGVDRVVIVPPTLEGTRLDYAQEAVRRYPGRFAIMARIALDDPQTALRFPRWKEQQGVVGIRLNIAPEQVEWLTNGTADWFWPAAERAGIPVMFLTRGQTSLFGPIADRHPRLPLIIDHMGVQSSAIPTHGLANLIAQSAALAKYPNVSVKLSASPLFSSEPYPFRDVTPYIRRLFDAFGPRRSYWDSDITASLAKATYRQRVTQFTEELPFLSEDDKDWVMGRAIMERLGWA